MYSVPGRSPKPRRQTPSRSRPAPRTRARSTSRRATPPTSCALTDAHALFGQAVAKDANFALAYLGLANTAGTTKEFFDALEHAVARRSTRRRPGEQLEIHAAEAGAKADPAHQKEQLDKLVAPFPNDARVQNQVGAYYFGRLDYATAIAATRRRSRSTRSSRSPTTSSATRIASSTSSADAERTFKKYIELLPDDPNPYDSYAELLMEEGKFDESIKSYEKALAIDRNFIASYIGIGNDQMFAGKTDDARKTLARLTKAARNDGERRQAACSGPRWRTSTTARGTRRSPSSTRWRRSRPPRRTSATSRTTTT